MKENLDCYNQHSDQNNNNFRASKKLLQDFQKPNPKQPKEGNSRAQEFIRLTLDASYSDLIEDQSKSACISAQKQISSYFNFLGQDEVCFSEGGKIPDDFHQFSDIFDVSLQKCGREHQQDRFSAIFPFQEGSTDAFFGVYDGHSTDVVSEYLKNKLPSLIAEQQQYQINTHEAIKTTYQNLDEEITRNLRYGKLRGGSTALTVIIRGEKLILSNLGDSRAALIQGLNHNITILNQSVHRPDQSFEYQRLQDKNAILLERNGMVYINGELGISRSFGDYEYKDLVSCQPDILEIDLTSDHQYLLLGTDGFWDTVNSDIITQFLRESESIGIQRLSWTLTESLKSKETRFQKDNMTLIIVDLEKLRFQREQLLSVFSNSSSISSQESIDFSESFKKEENHNNNDCYVIEEKTDQKHKNLNFNFDMNDENQANAQVESDEKISCGKMKPEMGFQFF